MGAAGSDARSSEAPDTRSIQASGDAADGPAPPILATRRLSPRAARFRLGGAVITGAFTLLTAIPLSILATDSARAQPSAAPSSSAAGAGAHSVTITPTRSTLTVGVDSQTSLAVTVVGPLAGAAVPSRTLVTVGELQPLVAGTTPGTFTAEYRVPKDRIPQAAIVFVELSLPGGARLQATTRLMLPAATTFPLRTSPSANVTLEVAGQLFGPVKADNEGNVSVPIVVPPDVAVGLARAVNRFGIENQTEVNLQPRDYPRVLVIAPPEGEAGATVDVEVWGIAPSGEPIPPEGIDLRAPPGSVRRAGGMPGVASFAFTLPAQVGSGTVELIGATADGTSARSEVIALRAGPPSDLVISADSPRLVVGSGAISHLKVVVQDRFGNPTASESLRVTVDGEPAPVRVGGGEVTLEVLAPAAWTGRHQLTAAAALGNLLSRFNLLVTGGPPARATLAASRGTIEGDDRNGVDFTLELFDVRGTPTLATRVAWQGDEEGTLESLQPDRFGTYAVRLVPRRTLRDREAVITAQVDTGLEAKATVLVEAATTRTATVRVGLISNLGGAFGQSAFVEATHPLRYQGRFGRLFSVGVTLGYVHSEASSSNAGEQFPGLQLSVNQTPLLALGRMRLPGPGPVELAVSLVAGVTVGFTSLVPNEDPSFASTRGTASAPVVGAGVDTSILLQPGELVVGTRYLHAELGRNSNGDVIAGNVLGLMFDVGFRMGF